MKANPIVRYEVRVPGQCAWSSHRTERAAIREREVADRTIRPGHHVYAVHADGTVTGPYDQAGQ